MTGADEGSRRRPGFLAVGGCVVLTVVGVLVTLACLLALRIETSGGFAGTSDSTADPGYLVALAAGAAAGVLVPAAVCFAVLPRARRAVVVVAGVLAVVLAVIVFGVL